MVWLLLRCTVGSSPLLAVAVSSVAAGGGFGASLWAPPIRRPVRSTPTLFWVCIQVACLWCIAAAVSLGASVVPAALWLGVSPWSTGKGVVVGCLRCPCCLHLGVAPQAGRLRHWCSRGCGCLGALGSCGGALLWHGPRGGVLLRAGHLVLCCVGWIWRRPLRLVSTGCVRLVCCWHGCFGVPPWAFRCGVRPLCV